MMQHLMQPDQEVSHIQISNVIYQEQFTKQPLAEF